MLSIRKDILFGVAPIAVLVPFTAFAQNAADFVPSSAPIAISIRDGSEQVRHLQSFVKSRGLFESPAFEMIRSNPGFAQARLGMLGIAAAAETTPWEAIGTLLGEDAVIALVPGGGNGPGVIAVSISHDGEVLDRLLHEVHIAAGLIVNGQPDASRSKVVNGVRAWAISDELFESRKGNALILSNRKELLASVLNNEQSGLSSKSSYAAMAGRVADSVDAWLYVDTDALRGLPGANAFVAPKAANPLGGFLFGGWSYALGQSDAAGVWLDAESGAINLDVDLSLPDDMPIERRAFLNHLEQTADWDATALPGYLADMTLQRDWPALFSDREALLSLDAAGQVVNFSTGLSTLLGQLDFMDDLLPRVNGPVRVVLARQDFSASTYQPTPRIPSFSLVVPLDMRGDDELRENLNSGAISVLSIIGVDQAQKDQTPLRTKLGLHRDIQYVYGVYPPPRDRGMEGEYANATANTVNVAYNFAPAIAVLDDALVIATSKDSLQALIDSRLDAAERSVPVREDELRLNASALAMVLSDNLEELVMSRMLNKNESREQAEQFVKGLLSFIEMFDAAKITSTASESGFHGQLRLWMKVPDVR